MGEVPWRFRNISFFSRHLTSFNGVRIKHVLNMEQRLRVHQARTPTKQKCMRQAGSTSCGMSMIRYLDCSPTIPYDIAYYDQALRHFATQQSRTLVVQPNILSTTSTKTLVWVRPLNPSRYPRTLHQRLPGKRSFGAWEAISPEGKTPRYHQHTNPFP